jgi:GNAT superfamily N-acetyltransferase
MTPTERMALEHENWLAYLTSAARCSATARVQRAGGVVAILSDLPSDWFNQILVEQPDATPAGLLSAVEAGRRHARDFVVRLREGVDDRFMEAVAGARLTAAGEGTTIPGMVAFPIDRDAVTPTRLPGFEIHRVMDADGLDAHRRIVTDGFGSPPAVAEGTTCAELLQRPECVAYVGYADGSPVVSGLGWRTGRTIGVYAIATVPAARRHGYAAAMAARVVTDGVAAGCDVAALQASVVGRPIYERLGFRVAVTYIAYQPAHAGRGS